MLEVFEGGFYIKIRALLTNNTELYIREYSDINERNYSYHWQSADGKMIMRWDNANHHKNIDTYPHHVHHTDNILPSCHISCEEILNHIETMMFI
ncbi:MAG: DUF6516 family protein [Thermodesulfovibrionales bacterium]|nr:DUF6516 family protein [Thermodesulfovibrionales bacterium]